MAEQGPAIPTLLQQFFLTYIYRKRINKFSKFVMFDRRIKYINKKGKILRNT